jgi:hypothetical protein
MITPIALIFHDSLYPIEEDPQDAEIAQFSASIRKYHNVFRRAQSVQLLTQHLVPSE